MEDGTSNRIYYIIGGIAIVGALVAVAVVAFPEVFQMAIDYFKAKILGY